MNLSRGPQLLTFLALAISLVPNGSAFAQAGKTPTAKPAIAKAPAPTKAPGVSACPVGPEFICGASEQALEIPEIPAPLPADCHLRIDENKKVFGCLDKPVLKWTGWQGNICGEFSPQGAFRRRAPDSNACLTESLAFFQWTDAKATNCVAYNACGVQVGDVDAAHCRDKPNHFAKKWPNKGFTWADCKRLTNWSTIPFDQNGKFVPACAPDTLYSWRRPDFVQYYVRQNAPGRLLDLHGRMLYTWRTPIGSFGYARESIRIKLKANARFQWIDATDRDCEKLRKSFDITRTVFAANGAFGYGNYSEYLLCSDGPVASWSHDTAPHVEEMKRERAWMQAHTDSRYLDFDALSGHNNQDSCPWNYQQDWDSTSSSSQVNWSKQQLSQNIASITQQILKGSGKVYFAQNEVPSLWNHFATQQPGYFNSYNSRTVLETWKERDPNGCRLLGVK